MPQGLRPLQHPGIWSIKEYTRHSTGARQYFSDTLKKVLQVVTSAKNF